MSKVRSDQLSKLQRGTLLREKIRGVPTDLKLRVSLDASLGNQLEAAKAALQKLERVQIVSADQGADCILGRLTPAVLQQVKRGQTQRGAVLPNVETVGLFLTGLRPIAPTFSEKTRRSSTESRRALRRTVQIVAGRKAAETGDR